MFGAPHADLALWALGTTTVVYGFVLLAVLAWRA